ncbi:hypothetical protein OUZ56_018546 [Daphnia magna]|uniref:Uncharacterized protein n=1 Tax=Daphnia magna TaxID=35525 RepID=A0ABQ9Z954_9CRUS|nr:hypothetical protein OUZ56_018546 [Daphnia magna]
MSMDFATLAGCQRTQKPVYGRPEGQSNVVFCKCTKSLVLFRFIEVIARYRQGSSAPADSKINWPWKSCTNDAS